MYNNNPLLQFFTFEHLKGPGRDISEKFAKLAQELDEILPKNPETSAAFRKLLEAKDCAVRSTFFKSEQP